MTIDLVTLTDARSPRAEAYRSLRTNLEFSNLDEPLKSMLVSSTAPGEGKSTTLANLGVINAQAGERVILLDCDMRRPKLHELLRREQQCGESLPLCWNPDGDLPLQNTEVDNLLVIACRPPAAEPRRPAGIKTHGYPVSAIG